MLTLMARVLMRFSASALQTDSVLRGGEEMKLPYSLGTIMTCEGVVRSSLKRLPVRVLQRERWN